MPTFKLKPNLRIINRYLTNTTDADFDLANPNYQVNELEIFLPWDFFEPTDEFETGFRTLLKEYNLIAHYDNLLYLTLQVFDKMWEGIQIAHDQYKSMKRSRELAQLLIALMETKEGKLSSISFKGLLTGAKVTDSIVNDWISNLIVKAVESKDFPIAKFGTPILKMISDDTNPFTKSPLNVTRLKAYANKRLVNPKNQIRKGAVIICLKVLSYLNEETTLKSPDEVMFTDHQLRFLFDLLSLLKKVDDDDIKTIKEDYTRTLILNYIGKQLTDT